MTCFGVFVVFYGKIAFVRSLPPGTMLPGNCLTSIRPTVAIAVFALAMLAGGASRRLPERAVPPRSIGASGDRCRCKRAVARSRWIRWLGRPSARSAASRVSPTRRRNRSLIPPRCISRCFSPGRAGIGRQALTECRAPKVARGSPPHISRTPGTASRCCWSTRSRCAPRWGCRPTRSTSPSSISAGRRSSFRRPAKRASSSPGRKKLLRDRPQRLDALQRKGLDLAERYWTYQDVRRGQKLEVLPVQDSKTQQWVSVARLMQTKWDDKTDATGEIRKAKDELQKVRAAYLANAAEDFNAASANFLAALREIGPQLGNYPSAEIIDLEVAYNHWAPFRIAWVCTLLALLGVLLSWTSRWRSFHLGRPGLLRGRHAGHVGRLRHAHGNRRAGAGHQYVRIGGVRRLRDRRVGAGVSTHLSQGVCADGRGGRLHPGADTGRHLPDNPRPQHTSVDAGAAEQLLAGHPRDDHHAQLRRFCPGAVDRQYRARFLSAACRRTGPPSRF